MYAKDVTTTFVERGPLKTVVKVSYAYVPAAFRIRKVNQNTTAACGLYGMTDPCDTPVMPRYYTSTITLEAGQPSIQLEEDTNQNFAFNAINIYNQVQPDQGRYRGHHANTITQGRFVDGSLCTGFAQDQDCIRDFNYTAPVYTCYFTDDTNCIAYMQPW